jgi:predicted transglutaminase-like cysteine proteinase
MNLRHCFFSLPRIKWHLVLVAAMVAALLTWSAHGAADFDKLLSTSVARWGNRMVAQVSQWRNVIRNSNGTTELERLTRVNNYFNQLMRFGEDTDIWGQLDYWATPMESLHRAAGDCEDFAIAKYYTLLETGIPAEKLRLTYVRAKLSVFQSPVPHMVLAYYEQPTSEPLILDNLIAEISPASRRTDLTPVFTFNSLGIFNGSAGTTPMQAGGTSRYSKWTDLMRRARAEGFE